MRAKTLYAFLLCLLTAVSVSAQQPVVKSFRLLTFDHIPADLKRNDLNNKPCALVKVQVVADIIDVQGARIGDVVKRNATEKWVYMCDQSPKMKVFLKNCLPVEVNFARESNNEIKRLKSNLVYELVLEVPNATPIVDPQPTPDNPGGYMKMHVMPVTAEITIWGNNMAERTIQPQPNGTVNLFLPYGRYYYRATAEGYHPSDEATFFFSDESDPIVVQLTPIMGQLSIVAAQNDVSIYINEQEIVKSKYSNSWSLDLDPGLYDIKAIRKKCDAVIQTVSVFPQQVTHVTIPYMKTREEIQKERQDSLDFLARHVQDSLDFLARHVQDSLDFLARHVQDSLDSINQIRNDSIRSVERIQKQQRKEERTQRVANTDNRGAQFGIIAGLNMANAAFGSDYDSPSGVTAFHVGMTLDVRLSKGLYFSPGLVYSAKGYSYASDKHNYGVSEKANPQYIDIPLLLSLRTAGTSRLQFSAGPYLAMAIGGKVKDDGGYYDVSFSEAYSGFDYGMQVGAQLRIGSNISLGASYQMGMASSYQNRCLGISLGYHF